MGWSVFYDWETIGTEPARTDGVSGETITDCALAFTAKMEEAGYEGGVYAYRKLGYFSYDLSRLADREIWLSAPGDYPDFYYAHSWWQYSYEGKVPGIEVETDLNLYFPALIQAETE